MSLRARGGCIQRQSSHSRAGVSTLACRVNSLADIAVWLDSAHTLAPLTLQPLSVLEWEHVGTTLALWIGVPLLAGLRRIRGSDID